MVNTIADTHVVVSLAKKSCKFEIELDSNPRSLYFMMNWPPRKDV